MENLWDEIPWNWKLDTSTIISDAANVLNQSKWLTKPWSDPDHFNWELLINIESPKWFPVTHKFYTEQGSEYIRTYDGSTRRIKSYHSNTEWEDMWLKDWFENAIFTKGETWYDFNLAVQLLKDKWYTINIYRIIKDGKNISVICILDGKRRRQANISDAYSQAVKEWTIKDWPLVAEYTSYPELNSHILQFNIKNGVVDKIHPWSKVSYIENFNK